MANVTLTIPDEQIERILSALEGLYPIPVDSEGIPLFTANQWGKESIRRWLITQVARWETKQVKEAAVVAEEDDLVT